MSLFRKSLAITALLSSGLALELSPAAIAEPLPPEPLLQAQATQTPLDYLNLLNSIPVFGILDSSGNPILASGDYEGQTRQVAYVWMDPQEALAVLEEVRREDPALVADAEVTALALGEVLIFSESQEMPEDWLLQVIPRPVDVAAAEEIWALEDSDKTEDFEGIPMFYGTTGGRAPAAGE